MDSNSFGNVDITLPENFREHFHQYCLTRSQGSRNDPEGSPFPRMVDMWFLAVCIAIHEGLSPAELPRTATYKAIEGAVFGSDPWRSNAMMLIAIAYTGDVDVTTDPNTMMRLVNGYALAGLPRLVSILEERGAETALDHLSDAIEEILRRPCQLDDRSKNQLVVLTVGTSLPELLSVMTTIWLLGRLLQLT